MGQNGTGIGTDGAEIEMTFCGKRVEQEICPTSIIVKSSKRHLEAVLE